ncbi:PIN domain-containing protein [archaeon]|jgi:predicted nucleic acid-binding protein|nr:PIN domain-containing protein [archaeon]MBT4241630.1 PIN domain-containing protein [archaeon]MBT4418025.1 PIN domain-containing protein [archaeon]
MDIVIDTNIFISALIRDNLTRELIFNFKYNLLFPEFEFEEIFNHKKEILRKSKLTDYEFNILLLRLLKKVKIIRTKRIIENREEAKKIIEKIDPNDVIFIATALTFNCPIWSDDKHFQKQNKVKVLTTKDIINNKIIKR